MIEKLGNVRIDLTQRDNALYLDLTYGFAAVLPAEYDLIILSRICRAFCAFPSTDM